jgi:hypothetical protein
MARWARKQACRGPFTVRDMGVTSFDGGRHGGGLAGGRSAVCRAVPVAGRLGAGGMGQVFLGRPAGGRLVAVKVIRPELAGGARVPGPVRAGSGRRPDG